MLFDEKYYTPRTAQSFIDDGLLATEKEPIRGIFGPSLVSKYIAYS